VNFKGKCLRSIPGMEEPRYPRRKNQEPKNQDPKNKYKETSTKKIPMIKTSKASGK
jgi:hypothetical protein